MSVFAGFKKSSTALAAGFAFSLAFSASAFALDGKAFMDTLQDGMQPYGLSLNYQGEPEVKGDKIALKNVRLLQKDAEQSASLPIYLGSVNFEAVTAEKDGSFNVGKIAAGQDSAAQAEAALKAGDKLAASGQIIARGMEITSAHISPKGKIYTIAQYLPYKSANIQNISYQADGKIILSLDGLSAQYTKQSDDTFQNSSSIAAFTYDPTAWPGQDGQDAKELLSGLGYDKISGNFAAVGSWNPQKGDLDISEYKLSADKMGSLAFSGKLSGVTQVFANNYQKLALQQMEVKNPTPQQQQQMNQDALGLASQLDFNAFTLTYKDNSLGGRILDYMSKSAAVARPELVSILKAGVLANTQDFKNTGFATMAANQINAFLDNPQSFRLTSRPAKPASFAAILLTAGISPEKLIDLLGIDVAANK